MLRHHCVPAGRAHQYIYNKTNALASPYIMKKPWKFESKREIWEQETSRNSHMVIPDTTA